MGVEIMTPPGRPRNDQPDLQNMFSKLLDSQKTKKRKLKVKKKLYAKSWDEKRSKLVNEEELKSSVRVRG